MLLGGTRRGARLTWDGIRGRVIEEFYARAPPGALEPSALLRCDGEAAARLESLIAEARQRCQERKADTTPVQVARLASLLDLRGQHKEALDVLGELGPESTLPEAGKLLRKIIERHVALASQRSERELRTEAPEELSVPIVDAASVSAQDFSRRFIEPGLPCVLRGAGVAPDWSAGYLGKRLGRRYVPLRRRCNHPLKWARMELAGTARFKDFAAELVAREKAGGPEEAVERAQVFDYSIWQSCADALADEVRIPRWFCTDLYSYCSGRIHPITGSASPTLFLADAGSSSGLHVDFLQTHFWMALCRGRKRWRLVPREDLALLYPKYLVDLNPSFPFELDAIGEGSASHQALRHVRVGEVILEPGDLIFIPRGWAHQVENLEATVALSANFIDGSNLEAAHSEAELLGLVSEDPRVFAGELGEAKILGVPAQLAASAPEDHMPLRAFKARHGETLTPQVTKRIVGSVVFAVAALGGGAWLSFRHH